MTRRKILEYWTEVKRVVWIDGDSVVKQTVCCCDVPGGTPRECREASGNKTNCRCHCHRAMATAQELAEHWGAKP